MEATCVQCDAGKYSAGTAQSSSAAWFVSPVLLHNTSRLYSRAVVTGVLSSNSLFAPPARSLSAHCK
jgi:hypothetical protein